MKEIKLKVLFDSNVIIDAITARENCSTGSKELFMKAVSGEIEGLLVSKQITDIYYSLRKYVELEKRNSFVAFLLKSFTIIAFNKEDLENALKLEGKDYEDNVLISIASDNLLDYIVTNNIDDFKLSKVVSILPSDLLKKIN